MRLNENENQTSEKEPNRIKVITGLAVEYTIGPDWAEDLPTVNGVQQATEEDIMYACSSEEMSVLSVLMEHAFLEFCKMYPCARASAKIIPINGMPEIDMIEIKGE